jgi:large subunit ribosomal protein L1
MNKEQVLEALKEAKENSKKRNFKQSYDLIINLKNFDLKKNNVDAFVTLPNERGKKVTVCALVGRELEENAKKVCDKVIVSDDFKKLKKKEIKKLAGEFSFFIAQANLMPQVATVFGRVFGPKGKMPNPKVGCIVPPNANLAQVYAKLQKTVRIASKKSPLLQCSIGAEDFDSEKLANNFMAVYNTIVPVLPNDKNSVKNISIKLTMGKPVIVGSKKKDKKKK